MSGVFQVPAPRVVVVRSAPGSVQLPVGSQSCARYGLLDGAVEQGPLVDLDQLFGSICVDRSESPQGGPLVDLDDMAERLSAHPPTPSVPLKLPTSVQARETTSSSVSSIRAPLYVATPSPLAPRAIVSPPKQQVSAVEVRPLGSARGHIQHQVSTTVATPPKQQALPAKVDASITVADYKHGSLSATLARSGSQAVVAPQAVAAPAKPQAPAAVQQAPAVMQQVPQVRAEAGLKPVVPRLSPAAATAATRPTAGDFRCLSAGAWAAIHLAFPRQAVEVSKAVDEQTMSTVSPGGDSPARQASQLLHSAIRKFNNPQLETLAFQVGPALLARAAAAAAALPGAAKRAAAEPQVQAAGAGGAVGAVVLGAGGGTAGLLGGGFLGGALGLPLAPFTLGLSIPLSAALAGAAGCATGAALGGGVGLVGGGAAGYSAYGHREELRGAAAGAWEKVETSSAPLRQWLTSYPKVDE